MMPRAGRESADRPERLAADELRLGGGEFLVGMLRFLIEAGVLQRQCRLISERTNCLRLRARFGGHGQGLLGRAQSGTPPLLW